MNYPTYDDPSMSLRRMQHEVVEIERDLGWTGPGVDVGSFGDRIALLHTEVSEAYEAYRRWGLRDATAAAGSKPEGVGSEFADILIRLLTEAERFDIDLPAEYERKVAYNRTREPRHGGKRI